MKTGKNDHLYLLLFLALLIAMFGFAYRNLLPWHMLVMCDLSAWFPSAGAAYQNFGSSWSHIYLGKVGPLAPGEFLVQFSLISLTGGNAAAAQGIFYLSLLPLSAITMYLFLRHLISSNLGRILASVLYGVNGLTIEWFLAGGYSFLPWHVFFPLLMLYLIKILEEKEGRILNMFIFSLFLGFIASYQVHMYMLWLFLPFIIVFFIVEIAYRRSRKYTINTVLLFLGSAGILLLLLAPILADAVSNLFSYYTAPSATSPMYLYGYSQEFLIQAIRDNYALGSTTNMFNRFTYVMVLFAFFSLFIRNGKRLRYYLGFLLIGALVLLFARLLAVGWILDLFRIFPILFVIKGPTLLAFMLCWTIFPMMAILIAEVQERLHFRIKSSQKLKQAIVLIPLCGILIAPSLFMLRAANAAPFNDPRANAATFFSHGLLDDPSKVDLGKIPPSFDRACNWLHERRETEGFFRTAWLPGYWMVIDKVLAKYDPPTLAGLTSSAPDYMILTLMPLLRGDTEDVGKLLAPFDVKYIVVSLEQWEGKYLEPFYKGSPRFVFVSPMGWYAIGGPQEYVKLLNKQRDLKLVASEPGFLIYENLDFVPHSHVSIYNKMFLVAPMSSIAEPYEVKVLVQKSDFEDGFGSWIPNTSLDGAKYSVNNTVSYSGQYSLRMEIHALGSYATIYQRVEVTENTVYYLSVWLKGENTKTAGVRIYFHNSENRFIECDDGNFIGLWFPLEKEWSKGEALIKIPKGAVRMDMCIDMGMEWTIIDKAKPAIAWFDDITLEKPTTTLSPVRNPWYLYGSPDRFPARNFNSDPGLPMEVLYKFLHGQMLIRVPDLFSKLPYLVGSHHLLVYGDFLPSDEDISQYLALSNAVVFLGDVDISKPYEKWTDEPEVLLFVYEAEANLIFTPFEQIQEIVADDNLASFWKGGISPARVGNIGVPQISNDTAEKVSGSDSLKIIVGSGKGASWYIYHNYLSSQNWSAKESLSLYWYGGNSGGVLRFTVITTPYDVFQATFVDNFSGWRRINLPFNTFSTTGNPNWGDINSIEIQMIDDNVSGTWYLDRTVIITTPPQKYSIVNGETLSYGSGIEVQGDREGKKEFFAPRANYFRVLIRAQSSGHMTIEIDGQLVNIVHSYASDNGFSLHETTPVYLEKGNHQLLIKFAGDKVTLDQILLLSTKHENATFGSVFYSKQPTLNYAEISPSRYDLELKSDEPCFIILRDSFHPEWQAHTEDGANLEHVSALPLGWANGFYLAQGGEGKVTIIFGREMPRRVAIIIWEIALGSLIAGIGYLSLGRGIKSKSQALGSKAKNWVQRRYRCRTGEKGCDENTVD